ncbi:MAG: hypothetical protein UW95_C0013G0018 [Parcubacteria group bacterium GW2011_GWC1_45_14]|nr:MAG: hypothetical protein UW87_C0015G0004 [Candidatus Moranbacteria bacterium GW2011_GWC2_45_10]KKT94554.1 MAG: hypothetical protein UW95_C0013G0018 [Parcubacteria group bacterium GW2011_GWC1_45_14]
MSNISNSAKNNKEVSFVEILENITSNLPQRSREIVWGRYGIGGAGVATLEEIGGKFGITRERVRQVIREVCKKVKAKSQAPVLSQVHSKIEFTLESNSGIMEIEKLLEKLGGADSKQKGAARFFLDCLDDAQEFEIKGVSKKAFMLPDFDQEEWMRIKDEVIEILKKKKSPVSEKALFDEFSVSHAQEKIEKKKLLDYLEVSKEIKKNTFGKWGLAKWKEVNPKGTRDKAYLILKEDGKPMHFKDIAEEIDKSGLNKKKTHPQTVHNELIKDKKFVLVGRGIYALAEWGYEKGTVKDVLEDILKKYPAAMTREEIIKEVLKVRQVKKSTVIINLNNYFKKTKEGKYTSK